MVQIRLEDPQHHIASLLGHNSRPPPREAPARPKHLTRPLSDPCSGDGICIILPPSSFVCIGGSAYWHFGAHGRDKGGKSREDTQHLRNGLSPSRAWVFPDTIRRYRIYLGVLALAHTSRTTPRFLVQVIIDIPFSLNIELARHHRMRYRGFLRDLPGHSRMSSDRILPGPISLG